jgi:MFS family permease
LKTQGENSLFPPGLNNAFVFAMFNALSFQIVLASPMVLYAKALGAGSTVLGIISGMMPLLVILQIPAAHYVDRVGYKRFVYAGWGMRVMFIFFIALVPLTGRFLDANTRLALVLMLLFCFNLSRGISSAAWLPWIASLVPEAVRGKYLARDQASVNFASFLSFVLAGLCLGQSPRAWQFGVLFAISAGAGAVSLFFLKRIPDVAPPEQVQTSTTAVPWGEMLRYRPFRRLLRMIVAWSVAYGGLTTFTVAFLTESGMAEGKILLVTSVMFLGGLTSLLFLGRRLDVLGSKPVLRFSFCVWILILAGWMALAGGVLSSRLSLVLWLQALTGLFAALVVTANTRLAMAVTPVMGRNHFFAIYSVVGSVSLGLSPIAWGLVLDAIGPRRATWLGLTWNRYTIYFSAVAVVFLFTFALATRLDEPKAVSMEALLKEILIQSPQRVWVRLWPRG